MAEPLTELSIERLSQLGDGVAHHEGRTVFVEGALPGERVRAEVIASGKVLRAEIRELLERSPHRREPACAHAGRCGGCDWLHASEHLQREAKREIAVSALEHLGGIPRTELEVEEPAVSKRPLGYRRRAVLHFEGRALGLFGRRSHELVPFESCPALVKSLELLPGPLGEKLQGVAKDAESLTVLAEGSQVAFSLALKVEAQMRHLQACERAVEALRLRGAVVVPHDGQARLLGDPVLKAENPLRPEVPLYLRPDLFAQANAEANLALTTAAATLVEAREGERILELYSGNGNLTFAVAGTAGSVLAVESSGPAVSLAQRSAREGGVGNVRFVQGDAAQVCRGLAAEGQTFDALLLDPPRVGAAGVQEWAARLGVRRVVYVACDPASLARDAAELVSAGFRPRKLQLVDLFPQTRHVEAVMSLERAAEP
ncbi:MAG: 23S rRNA (uracil(1939)-C(5))-methyltransferase RlmD [Myxococcales bacterium]|nr:23S rRNA (uracil(1939)-C(5))-methyltransferase RlmD [Myxococcales bacterium]